MLVAGPDYVNAGPGTRAQERGEISRAIVEIPERFRVLTGGDGDTAACAFAALSFAICFRSVALARSFRFLARCVSLAAWRFFRASPAARGSPRAAPHPPGSSR